MAFEITMVLAGPVAEITLSGDLDSSSAHLFQQKLGELKGASSMATQLVLQVRDLEYMSSAGIRMLIFAKQRLGLRVYVVAPQEQILDTLRRTGVHTDVVVLNEYPPTTGSARLAEV